MRKTVNRIILDAYEKFKDEDFVFEKQNGKYQSITYGKFTEDANSIAKYLLDNGYRSKKIIIWAKNSCNYMKIDVAIMAYVGMCVNVSAKTSLRDLTEVAQKIGCDTVLYDLDQKIESTNDINFISFDELLAKVNFTNNLLTGIKRNRKECINVFFSSGTTSKPKGAMLNTENIFWGWEQLQKRTKFTKDDVIYLFLPLNHTYANIYNFLYSFLSGVKVYLCSDTNSMAAEIREVNPTLFCAVPLVFQRFADAAGENLKYAFGSRIRYLYTGGSIIDRNLRQLYADNGLKLLNAYALTEVSSSFAVDYPDDENIYSEGTIYDNIDVKAVNINEEGIGDIVVAGGNIFMGYINDEALTKQAFTDDGYFITGDLGYIKDNHLYIVGRKDKVLICSNGENVNITRVENRLKEISDNIIRVKAAIVDDHIVYTIYVSDKSIDTKEAIEKYNSETESIYQVKQFEILDRSSMSFKD